MDPERALALEPEPRDGDGDVTEASLLPFHREDEKPAPSAAGGDAKLEGRNSIRGLLFVVLGAAATLAGRTVLRAEFPFCFIFITQVSAYALVAIFLLLLTLNGLRNPTRHVGANQQERLSLWQKFQVAVRLSVSAVLAAVAVLCGAKALMLYENLAVLAVLPILTYVVDSFILRLLHIAHISRHEDVDILWSPVWKVVLIPLCLAGIIFSDYRLDTTALFYALESITLISISRSISRIGPRFEKGPTSFETPLSVFFWTGIPVLVVTGYATFKYDDVVAAFHVTHSWGLWRRLTTFIPGICLYIVFSSSMNSAYPFVSQEYAGAALEDPSLHGKEAVRSTLHSGIVTVLIGYYGKELNLIDWPQAIAFTVVYVVSVGPRHIGTYPPRLLNFISRLLRRKSQGAHSERWQSLLVIPITTIVFAIFLSAESVYWIDTHSYNRNVKTWHAPAEVTLDMMYRSPQLRSLDMIIAHSPNDPLSSVAELIAAYTSIGAVGAFTPHVLVYTKASNLSDGTQDLVRGAYGGLVTVVPLRNAGGVTATFLHHIVSNWDSISQQTLFLSTTSTIPVADSAGRMEQYFQAAGFPLPDASDKTGFMNLGEQEVCSCGACRDSLGWEDTFHLLPSMWSAARPGASTCESVLLTRGNSFVASSARIRGVKKDVWQMLYDALTREDVGDAWSHDVAKLPKMLDWESKTGRWADDGVYGSPDSLEDPVLGLTIERLWAVLLQCSVPEIAWRCPKLGMPRNGRDERDCACVD